MILDASHLAEEAFWEALAAGAHAGIASQHSNPRALVPGGPSAVRRHDPRDRRRGRGDRLVLYNAFLDPAWRDDHAVPVTVDRQVRAHAARVAALAGWERVGIGSDLDGGLGLEESPASSTPSAILR